MWLKRKYSGSSIAVILLQLLSNTCQADPSSLKACQFAYNREFMERIALPTLKREEGDVYYVFDAKDPAITRRADGTILLIFDQKTGVIDAPLFTINFDPCSSRVISAGEVSSFPPA
jgi:hypothetical protein